ncbi:hypothetical protein EJ06DRAFT_533972 [Trichodelitschia bisporula]|uniref:tRNA wybutosine-synthesizing protein 2 n=1 Tax=Trichodelitschia bisporula TaxID=703511 RepID=A0A6G1HKX4_9PEZI|nr:hypothetical protein EJ06DRAFT_533972 [Trichodelitschia bisporula]
MSGYIADEPRAVLVPARYVKTVKTALEARSWLDRRSKIRRDDKDPSLHIIPTTLHHNSQICAEVLLLAHLNLPLDLPIELIDHPDPPDLPKESRLKTAVRDSLLHMDVPREEIIELLKDVAKGYSIYYPVLLLPAHAFSSEAWTKFLNNCGKHAFDDENNFFVALARRIDVKYIARNAPIPPNTVRRVQNVMRVPMRLEPLYGEWPSKPTFKNAIWMCTTQYGITQIWSPVHSMFSRGNIKEKKRLLGLESVKSAAEEGGVAVDLYAGIGYFALCYAKKGLKVLCWEVNKWSVEGVKRGANFNKWDVAVVDAGGEESLENEEVPEEDLKRQIEAAKKVLKVPVTIPPREPLRLPPYQESPPPFGERYPSPDRLSYEGYKLIVFHGTNAGAGPVVDALRSKLGPVRHVNCGLLPTSRWSWPTAVRCLDESGGWIHVHENFSAATISEEAEEVRMGIQAEVDKLYDPGQRVASVEHVERVKTYAPGVVHCVVDVRISPY